MTTRGLCVFPVKHHNGCVRVSISDFMIVNGHKDSCGWCPIALGWQEAMGMDFSRCISSGHEASVENNKTIIDKKWSIIHTDHMRTFVETYDLHGANNKYISPVTFLIPLCNITPWSQ